MKIAWKENVDSNVIVEAKDDQWYVGYYRKGEGMARTSSTREMIGADLREAVQPADLVVLVSVFVFECSVEH